MKSALTALLVLAFLLVVAWLLALWGTAPLPVTLILGTTVLNTSVPVAIMLVLAVLVLTFYLGRLTGWFLRLPGTLLNIRNRKAGQHLIDAYNAYLLEDSAEAIKRLSHFTPDTEVHALLANLLRLRDNLDTATRRNSKHISPIPPLSSSRHGRVHAPPPTKPTGRKSPVSAPWAASMPPSTCPCACCNSRPSSIPETLRPAPCCRSSKTNLAAATPNWSTKSCKAPMH
jgi:HAMP domain-containing protein